MPKGGGAPFFRNIALIHPQRPRHSARTFHSYHNGVMPHITLGNLIIDRNRFAAWIGHVPLPLTYVEFELLYELARHAGQVLSRQRLMRAVWHEPAATGDRRLTIHLSRLRSKLRESGPWRIETYAKRGYGLMDRSAKSSPMAAQGMGGLLSGAKGASQ